eukprot:14678871-Alexandrium_andersonii.AAC.1
MQLSVVRVSEPPRLRPALADAAKPHRAFWRRLPQRRRARRRPRLWRAAARRRAFHLLARLAACRSGLCQSAPSLLCFSLKWLLMATASDGDGVYEW